METRINDINAVTAVITVNNQIEDIKTVLRHIVMALEIRLENLAEMSAGIPQLEEQIAAAKGELAAGLLAFSDIVAEDESE
jgi:hypothetical protein